MMKAEIAIRRAFTFALCEAPMRTLKKIIVPALFVLVAACDQGIPTEAGPGPRLAGAAGVTVPLKGGFDFWAAPDAAVLCADGEIGIRATKIGRATHLGPFTARSTYCVDLAALAIRNGHTIYTAANGAELWSTFSGKLTGSPPVFGVEIDLIVVGGTGRFAGATGGAVVVGDFDASVGSGTVSMDGVLTWGGSSKR
jgi:hypothetical protein